MTPLAAATSHLTAPFAAIDLDAFDANASDLERRAGRLPIRVASKSVRVRELLARVLDRAPAAGHGGFRGVMAYSLAEAHWLVAESGHDDVFVAYPSVDAGALRALVEDPAAARAITLTIDSPGHVDLLGSVLEAAGAGAHAPRVALDVDASLRVGGAHLGVRRSPLREASDAAALARLARARGLTVVGLMFYDAQIAGLPDSSRAVRLVKARSHASLLRRRRAVVEAVGAVADLDFVNGGGTGSLHLTGRDGALTELAAGSGLLAPTLFDGYDDFTPRPAAFFAAPVVRRPGPGLVTVHSGGYIASGPPGWSRTPSVHDPAGLEFLRAEGAGEVQTPLRGPAADRLAIGDRVWFRHAKAGELFERFDEVHLVAGGQLIETVPTYRGEGRNFG
ncbi:MULTISPECIES: alanine racemase [unclassified Janibacter]|uniref:alanine racemase n=1 Tax=unclassified Janibacter TaxID=2649294 RepID=UPI003D078AE2